MGRSHPLRNARYCVLKVHGQPVAASLIMRDTTVLRPWPFSGYGVAT
jgi:hypothetical protein